VEAQPPLVGPVPGGPPIPGTSAKFETPWGGPANLQNLTDPRPVWIGPGSPFLGGPPFFRSAPVPPQSDGSDGWWGGVKPAMVNGAPPGLFTPDGTPPAPFGPQPSRNRVNDRVCFFPSSRKGVPGFPCLRAKPKDTGPRSPTRLSREAVQVCESRLSLVVVKWCRSPPPFETVNQSWPVLRGTGNSSPQVFCVAMGGNDRHQPFASFQGVFFPLFRCLLRDNSPVMAGSPPGGPRKPPRGRVRFHHRPHFPIRPRKLISFGRGNSQPRSHPCLLRWIVAVPLGFLSSVFFSPICPLRLPLAT